MPERPTSDATWPQWHKEQIDRRRKRMPRGSQVEVDGVRGGVYTFAGTPAEHPATALIGSLSIGPGDWVVTAGIRAPYDRVYLGVDLPGAGDDGGGFDRVGDATAANGSLSPLPFTTDDPGTIDVYAAVTETPGSDVSITVDVRPQP